MDMVTSNRFSGKVMVITGAAGGIGKHVALRAAKEGAKLVLADRKVEESKQTLEELLQITPDVVFLTMDLQYSENAKKLIDTAATRFGALDILVNNVGILGTPAPVGEMEESMFRDVVNNNLMVPFLCSHFAIPVMRDFAKGGAIVNVASVAGILGFNSHCAYVTTKHAVVGLTRSMAMDCPKFGIRVNAVLPGGISDTPMEKDVARYLDTFAARGIDPMTSDFMSGKNYGPIKRLATPEEVTSVILFLASDETSYMNGAMVTVDGGSTAF